MKVTQTVREFAEPIVESLGCTLWDVEYVREGGEWFLRLYIDKDGGVGIDDCEAVSRAVDPVLDERDPIPDSYTFEVSSAGLDRALKTPEHFALCMGRNVDVRLYRPRGGAKELSGCLTGYDDNDGRITLVCGGESVTLEKAEVAQVRLRVEF